MIMFRLGGLQEAFGDAKQVSMSLMQLYMSMEKYTEHPGCHAEIVKFTVYSSVLAGFYRATDKKPAKNYKNLQKS